MEPEIRKLLPQAANLYEKTTFSCLGAKNFAGDLTATKRKQAILVGMEAHVCILQTALDLHNRGYVVFVVADAVCSRQRENYETALRRLGRAGIIICDAESVLFEWITRRRRTTVPGSPVLTPITDMDLYCHRGHRLSQSQLWKSSVPSVAI